MDPPKMTLNPNVNPIATPVKEKIQLFLSEVIHKTTNTNVNDITTSVMKVLITFSSEGMVTLFEIEEPNVAKTIAVR